MVFFLENFFVLSNNKSMENVAKIDVESGALTVAEALCKVETELEILKLGNVKCAKIVHGYGSSGVGGDIKKGVLNLLKTLKKERKIEDFFACEAFSFTGKTENFYLKNHPNLVVDQDLKTKNFGITIVFL